MVTGGSEGLGKALCRSLVAEGAGVALCARGEERLSATAADLRAAGGEVLDQVVDVTDAQAAEHFVEATVSHFGRLDGLVNNAGRSSAMLVANSTDDDFRDDFELKVLAAARLCRLALPVLRRCRGAIVNVLAVMGKAPGAGSTPTAASRAAGLALTKALSKEAGSEGVRVNAVLVGFIESAQWERRAAAQRIESDELYAQLARSADIPLGRVGAPEEFADLVTYLLSARSSYVTGAGINIDGGFCAVP